MKIENIIFDLGNVLIDVDFTVFYQKLGYFPKPDDLKKAKQVIRKFEAGQIGAKTLLEKLNNDWGLELSLPEFKQIWTQLFSANQQMIELAEDLNRKYPVYILSNTDELHFPYIWQNFPQLHFFQDRLLLSYQLGTVKPSPEIYQFACQKHDILPEKTVFIDDKQENVDSARNLGFHTILHENYRKTKQELDILLRN